MKNYQDHAERYIKPALGLVKLSKLSKPDVTAFRTTLLRNVSRGLARNVLASVKAIINNAKEEGRVAHNVALSVRVKIEKRSKRKLETGRDVPSKQEINLILDKVAGRMAAVIDHCYLHWHACLRVTRG